jgi:hypothetical protein
MTTDDGAGLIGALGVLALVLLGLVLIVRGVLGGFRGSARTLTAPAGFGTGAFGRAVMSLLSFVVVYRFFFHGFAGELYGVETMLGAAVFAMIAVILIPALETLVAVAALSVFLIENTVVFGKTALGSFSVLLFVYAFTRWALGR